jgi:aspartate racemase
MEEAVSIPVWDMIGLSIKRILNERSAPLKLGVLASTASIKVGVFEQAFKNSGIHLMYPSKEDQNIILLIIKLIKSKALTHQNILDYLSVVEQLTRGGAQYLFVACTELSIISKDVKYPIPHYDTLEILTDEIIYNVKGL